MGYQFMSCEKLEVSTSEEIRLAVQHRRIDVRSKYSVREQSRTFRLAADLVNDAHQESELRTAAEIVGSHTHADLMEYDDLVGDDGCAYVVRWLDDLWNAHVSGSSDTRERSLANGR